MGLGVRKLQGVYLSSAGSRRKGGREEGHFWQRDSVYSTSLWDQGWREMRLLGGQEHPEVTAPRAVVEPHEDKAM